MAANGLITSLEAESQQPLPEMLKDLRYSEQQKKPLRDCLRQLATELTAMQTNTANRSGYLDLEVGVLNTGDFDGVVSKHATLSFSGGSFTINADKFTVVKAHGFDTIKFDADNPTDTEQRTYDAWRELVRNHSETPFEITLLSGDGKSFRYKAHLSK
jgi:hypothetical protein